MRSWAVVGPLAWALLSGPGVPPAGAGEPPSLDRVKARLQEQRQKLCSLYVHYRLNAEPLVELKTLAVWEMLACYPYAREDHIAFKGNKQYWRKIDLAHPLRFVQGAGEGAASAWPGRPPREPGAGDAREDREAGPAGQAEDIRSDCTMAFNGRFAWSYERRGAADHYVIAPAGQGLHFFQSEYLMSIGLRFPDQTVGKELQERMGQRSFLLPDALELHKYRVHAATERIEGAECVVLEGAWSSPRNREVHVVDKLWLDLEHGLALRRRDQSYNGRLGERWLTFKLEQVLPGYWLPRESLWQRAAPPGAPASFDNQVVLAYHMRVVKWNTNDVSDNLFDIPAAVKVLDLRKAGERARPSAAPR
jgi:hypothetical protein